MQAFEVFSRLQEVRPFCHIWLQEGQCLILSTYVYVCWVNAPTALSLFLL